MAGINNKYDYRSGLLNSLKVQHTASDVRNEDEYRKKVLNGLGVEYTDDDINQKNLYRAKVVEGLASSGGGGGSSDFSTAEVTITWNDSKLGELNWDSCPTIVSDSMITGVMYADKSPAIITVPLYKGKCYWERTTRGLTLSGNIEEYNDGDGMLITGDCTITIS